MVLIFLTAKIITNIRSGSKIQSRISKTEKGRKLVNALIRMRKNTLTVPFKKSATGVKRTESVRARAEITASIIATTVIVGTYFLKKVFRGVSPPIFKDFRTS